MARILIVHSDRTARKFLIGRSEVHHEVRAVDNLGRAMKSISSFRPNLILAGLNGRRTEGLDLLHSMKRARIALPVVICADASAGALQPMAMKLGARAFLEYPMEPEALDRAISEAMFGKRDAALSAPPVTREEARRNLSELEQEMNQRMVCFAGMNQVYLQSLILGNGQTTKPRIALKCSIRKRFGHPPDVYYEYIKDVCCSKPEVCPAYQEFQARMPT